MATKTKENNMTPLKTDLLAALAIGAIAGVLSPVIAANFNLKISWLFLFVGFIVLCEAGILVARIVGKYIPLIYKLGKFGEVGGLNFLVDLGVINLLVLISGVATGILTVVYKAISFSVAVINSYFWNKKWVFTGAQEQGQVQEASKFLIASLIGLGVNMIVFSVVKFGGPVMIHSFDAKTWVSLGTIVGSLSGIIFNFVLYKVWVFQD